MSKHSAEKDAGRVFRHKPEFTTDPADTYDVPPLPDVEKDAADAIRQIARQRLAVHGPHIECGNAGCRRRGLSGMHCNLPCEEAHEDCADFAAWSAVLATLDTRDIPPGVRS